MYFMILIISLFQGLLQGLPDPFTIVLLLIKGKKKCDLPVSLWLSFMEAILFGTETKTNSRAWLKGKHSWLVFNFLIPSHNWKIVKQSFSFFSFLFLLFQFPLYESFFIAAEKVREGKVTMPGNIMLVSAERSNSDG